MENPIDKKNKRLLESKTLFEVARKERFYGFLPDAINDFNQAIRLSKDLKFRSRVWFERAFAHFQLDNKAQAIVDLNKIIKLNLDEELVYESLGMKAELTSLSSAEFNKALLYAFKNEKFNGVACALVIKYLKLDTKAANYLKQFANNSDIQMQLRLANLFSKLSVKFPIFYLAEKNLLKQILENKAASTIEKLQAHEHLAKLFYYSAGSLKNNKAQFFYQCARNIAAVKQLNNNQNTETTEALTEIIAHRQF